MSWSHVQQGGAQNTTGGGSATTISATFTGTVAAGDLIIVGVANALAGTITVADNKNAGNYQMVPGTTGPNAQSLIFYNVVPNGGAAGTFTITATSASGGYPAISIDEFAFTGGGTISVDSSQYQAQVYGVTLATLPANLTTQASDLIFFTSAWGSAGTYTFSGTPSYNAPNLAAEAMGIASQYYLNTSTAVNPTISLSTSGLIASVGVAFLQSVQVSYSFNRIQSTPVLANHNQGGGTIGGLQADALAAPAACWDGTRWVMTVSIWNIANDNWSSAFFTAPDLATWTYVSGSLVSPSGTGSGQVLGNSGLAWFAGKYWWAYTNYPTVTGTVLAYSTNLTSWTTVGNPILTTIVNDQALTVNPSTGNLELWGLNSSRQVVNATSSNGTTWTDNSANPNLSAPSWSPVNFGEPQPWYTNGTRFLTCDTAQTSGYRSTSMFYWNSALYYAENMLTYDASNPWESIQVFDGCCVGPVNRGDGRGTQLWMLYAGGDVAAPTNNTDSCIGLAYMGDPAAITGSGAVTLATISAAGAGAFTAPASGAVTLGSIAVTGSGQATGPGTTTGSGAITLGSIAPAGAGGFSTTATGSIALATMVLSGSGQATGPGVTTGSGAITLGSIIVTSAANGGGIQPLWLPYEFTSVLITKGLTPAD